MKREKVGGSTVFQSNEIEITPQDVIDLLCSIHDDVIITDSKGKVLMASASTEAVYDIPSEQIVGMTVYELEREGYLNPALTPIALETGKRITAVQTSKSGKQIIGSVIPIKKPDGVITHAVGISTDITEVVQLRQQYERLEKEVRVYKQELQELRKTPAFDGIIGQSRGLQHIIKTLYSVSEYDASILITGESGTGKSKFARIIHENSSRRNGPFVEISCGAIPENLLESELFGYEAGSFTGASKRGKTGLIELAQNGTLFLDEVGELPLSLQVKLLKAIQSKAIVRVGGTREITIDFRLVSATNKNLEKQVANGLFRDDLYYRLNVIGVYVPPLRERKDDIIDLANHFLGEFNAKYGKNRIITSKVMEALVRYDWPGNIRELKNLIERITLTSDDDLIGESVLPSQMLDTKADKSFSGTLEGALQKLEKEVITQAYERYKTTTGVAKALGISQPTAARKIKKYVGTGAIHS